MTVADLGSGARRARSSLGAWCALTLAGAASFWVANVLISLTPAAADYRSAMSISYVPMLVEAAVGGLLLSGGMALLLLRLPDRVPGRGPAAKALVLAAVALVIVTVLVEVPSKLAPGVDDPVRWLVVATLINTVRVACLGLAIGLLARARDARAEHRTPKELQP